MKKLLALFLSVVMLMSFVALTASAAPTGKDFKSDYFPTGKIETPSAPYFKETQFEGRSTQLAMYYYQTSDIQKMSLDIQKQGEDEFCKQYGIVMLDKYCQIDAKFNDGEWISAKGSWDKVNENDQIIYGENVDAWNLNFLLQGDEGNDNADKLLNFTQCWLTYFEADNPVNDYFKPFVKTVKNDGENEFIFDFNETTITYRIRWCVKYMINQYKDNQEWVVITSDWSPETSIGKNGKQEELKMPEKIEAPVLSEFKLKANEDGSGEIKYFASLSDSIYDAERYQLTVKDGFEPYYIDAQVKINDGEWFTVDVANSVWLNNGYRSSYISDEKQLKTTDDAWIRVRICNHENDSSVTEWSNIIGTKAIEGEGNVKSPDGKLDGDTANAKCKLCGICPVQPLGICLFIWIAIILVVVIVAVIIISKKKKKSNN